MKAHLMYPDRDFDPTGDLPWNESDLSQDLELTTLFKGMAGDDKFLFDIARHAVLSGLGNSLPIIRYRQEVLRDCLRNPSIVRDIYAIALAAIQGEKGNYWSFVSRHPEGMLRRSVEILQIFVVLLKKLKLLVDAYSVKFESAGFKSFFAMLEVELDDNYFSQVEDHLTELKFRRGLLISAELGKGNKAINYVLRKKPPRTRSWIVDWVQERLPTGPSEYTFRLHPRDESGAQALSDIRAQGLNSAANALTQSVDHVLSFFVKLKTELAFYLGCQNLHDRLAKSGIRVCFPFAKLCGQHSLSFSGLYDVSLALTTQKIVGNRLNAENANLMIITGANQGGKSTFLRSLGQSQLMMQAGMFVPAHSFSAELCDALLTHYKREEDSTMQSGKLDEELKRMSKIVDHLTRNSIVLSNESFAATNEREGSQIAFEIVRAMSERHVRIFFVTHLYELAHRLYSGEFDGAVFLRAERQVDGHRTFKLVAGEPLQTSYGEDLYEEIFKNRKEPSNAS